MFSVILLIGSRVFRQVLAKMQQITLSHKINAKTFTDSDFIHFFFYNTNKVDVVHCMTQNHGSQPFTLASHFRKHQFSCQHQSNYIPAHVLLLFMSLYKWKLPCRARSQHASFLKAVWQLCLTYQWRLAVTEGFEEDSAWTTRLKYKKYFCD